MKLTIAALLTALLILPALPCLGSPPVQKPLSLSVEFFKKKIDLDKSQEGKLQRLLFDYDKGKIKKEGEIKYAELEFLDLLNQPAFDYDLLDAKFKQIAALQAGLGSFRLRKLLEAGEFLTDDQYKKYKQILLQMFFK